MTLLRFIDRLLDILMGALLAGAGFIAADIVENGARPSPVEPIDAVFMSLLALAIAIVGIIALSSVLHQMHKRVKAIEEKHSGSNG